MDLNDLFDDSELGQFSISVPKIGGTVKLRAATKVRPKATVSGRVMVGRPKTRKVTRKVKRVRPKPKRKLASKVMRLKRPVVRKRAEVMSQLPISASCPAAYRHLACHAGVGGNAAMALLKQIRDMVDLANTRALATSEHNTITNTMAFRKAVLKGLAQRRRQCR